MFSVLFLIIATPAPILFCAVTYTQCIGIRVKDSYTYLVFFRLQGKYLFAVCDRNKISIFHLHYDLLNLIEFEIQMYLFNETYLKKRLSFF